MDTAIDAPTPTTPLRRSSITGIAADPPDLIPGAPPVSLGASRPALPRPVRVLDAVHGARRAIVAGPVDLAIIAAVVWASGLGGALTVVACVVSAAMFTVAGVYRPRTTLETQGVLWYPAAIATPLAVATLALVVEAERRADSAGTAIAAMAIAALLLVTVRAVTWALLSSARRAGIGLRPTLVVGSGDAARTVAMKLCDYPEAGLACVGVLPTDPSDTGEGLAYGHSTADLASVVAAANAMHLVLVPEGGDDATVSECLQAASTLDVELSMLPPLAELFLDPGLVTQVGGLPLIALGRASSGRQAAVPGKRTFDVLGALVLLVITAPLMLLTAIAIKLGDGGPVLFRQRRVGFNGEPFSMLKFRSMVVGAERHIVDLRDHNATDGLLFKVYDDPRITRVGRVIRRLSIDELPQLFNVLAGSMSLVGPRPLAVDPDDFGPLDGRRHTVRPGITGYWQIIGGNGLTYAEMVKLDLAYIEKWSLWLDLRLLVRTVPALVHRRGPW